MDDRNTLDRALKNLGTSFNPVELPPEPRRVFNDTGAAWARWKIASCDLVNSWAANLMRSLYIRPFPVCPPIVRTSIRMRDLGKTDRSFALEIGEQSSRDCQFVQPLDTRDGAAGLGLDDPRHWLSAQQIADLALAGLPTTKHEVTIRAEAGRWIYLSRAPYGARLYCALCLPEAARDDYLSREKARV